MSSLRLSAVWNFKVLINFNIGGVITDQAEADEDMSLKQRLVLAGGSAMTGASEMVDNEIISGAMEVAGKNEKVCGQVNVNCFSSVI